MTRTATVNVTVGGGFQWDVTHTPPELVDPMIITITNSTQTTTWPAFGNHPKGQIYNFEIPFERDAVVTQDTSNPVRYPVRIRGGNNVRIIGLDISVVAVVTEGVTPGSPGTLKKIPNGMACQLIGNRTMFVEGCRIEMNGCHADQFVTRNASNISDNGTPARRTVFQNLACQGAQGTWSRHPEGDYLHSDFHQNQGQAAEPTAEILFENITQRTTASGIVMHSGVNYVSIRNFNFDGDDRYPVNNWILNPCWNDVSKMDWENVWTDFPHSAGMPAYIRNDGAYWSHTAGGVVIFSDEISQGHPPGGDFAPWDKLGLDYVSPHGLP